MNFIELAKPAPGWIATEKMLVAEFAIVLAMILIAVMRKRQRALFFSRESFNWFGGLMLVTSMFLVEFSIRVARLSSYERLSQFSLSPDRLIEISSSSPQIFGLTVFVCAFGVAMIDTQRFLRLRWLVIGICFALLLITSLIGLYWGSQNNPMVSMSAVRIAAGIILAIILFLALAVFLGVNDVRRSGWIHVIICLSVLSMYAQWLIREIRTGAEMSSFRLGLWLAITGVVLILLGNFRPAFAKAPAKPGQCPTCRYDLTGNLSGICPECGNPLAINQLANAPNSTTPV